MNIVEKANKMLALNRLLECEDERSNRQFLTPDWIAAEDAAGGVMAAGALATSEQPAQVEAVELAHLRATEVAYENLKASLISATPAPSVPDDVAEAARYFKAQGGHIAGLGVSRAANILWDYINDVLAAAPEVKS